MLRFTYQSHQGVDIESNVSKTIYQNLISYLLFVYIYKNICRLLYIFLVLSKYLNCRLGLSVLSFLVRKQVNFHQGTGDLIRARRMSGISCETNQCSVCNDRPYWTLVSNTIFWRILWVTSEKYSIGAYGLNWCPIPSFMILSTTQILLYIPPVRAMAGHIGVQYHLLWSNHL